MFPGLTATHPESPLNFYPVDASRDYVAVVLPDRRFIDRSFLACHTAVAAALFPRYFPR